MEPTTDLPHEMIEDSQRKWDAFLSAATHADIFFPDDSEFIEVSKRVFAFSNFIAGSCTQNPAMLADLQAAVPQARYLALARIESDELTQPIRSFSARMSHLPYVSPSTDTSPRLGHS